MGEKAIVHNISGVAAKLLRRVRSGAAISALLIAGAASAQHVGDRVRVWVSGDYYTGTIKAVGSGNNAGQYLIHFDKFATEQYALAKNVAPLGSATAARPGGKRGSNGCRIMVINGLPVCDPATVRRH